MGCTSLKKQKLLPMLPSKTVNGSLKVTIQQANIFKPPSKLFSMDPYLKLQMSNQQYRGFIHKKAGRLDLFNESFQFIINSCYKSSGRAVCIEVWDKHLINDQMIGMGTIDIDPIINFDEKNMMGSKVVNVGKGSESNEYQRQQSQKLRTSKCRMKVFLSHGLQEVGYLNTLFEFFQQPVVVVGFKFLYASLRRTSSIFTTMHIRIQVVAGQEVLCTQSKVDKDTKNPPSWQEEMLLFNIPSSLKQCLIRVLDKDQEVGRLKLYFTEIIGKKGEHQFTEQLENQRAISGVIKFFTYVGLPSVINESKRASKFEQIKSQLKNEIQPQTEMKRQLPLLKEAKYYDSEPKSTFQTLANEQEQSRTLSKTLKTFANEQEQSTKQKMQTSILMSEQEMKR